MSYYDEIKHYMIFYENINSLMHFIKSNLTLNNNTDLIIYHPIFDPTDQFTIGMCQIKNWGDITKLIYHEYIILDDLDLDREELDRYKRIYPP